MDARFALTIGNLVGRRLISVTGPSPVPVAAFRSVWLRKSRVPELTLESFPRYLRSSAVYANSASQKESKPEEGSTTEGTADQNATKVGEGEESEVEKTLRSELNKAVSDNSNLLSKSREFEDKYKRALAETENLRARLTKQINDAKLYAVQGFCKDMTEISDILRMAIDSVPKDQLTADNAHLKNLYDGLAMTDSRLMQVFKSHGLTQINPLDDKFNPNEHEAVVHQPVEGKDSGTVIFVSKVGYKLHDRVIRPAVVGVAK